MRERLQWTAFILSLAVFALVGWLCNKETAGFTRAKVENNFSDALVPPSPLSEEVKGVLSQEFHYFKRGAQSFAFLSEDGKWVLKLFNNRLKRARCLYHYLPFSYPRELAADQRLKQTYASYQIAATTLKDETGVVFANLSPADHPVTLTLVDKLGIKHTLSSRTSGFLLQKRTDLIYPAIKNHMKEGRPEAAQEVISKLIHLVRQCHDKGIVNHDPSIRKNFGIQDDRCFVIDVGRLVADPSLSESEPARRKHHFKRFRKWINRKYPQLLDYFDQRIAS